MSDPITGYNTPHPNPPHKGEGTPAALPVFSLPTLGRVGVGLSLEGANV